MVRATKRFQSRLLLYVLKEALPFTLLAFTILTTLVFVQQASKYSEITLSFQTSPMIARQFLLSLLPGIVVITLPVSLLLGTVITCSRLSSDGELTAAQSLGVSQMRLAIPFLLLGLLGTAATGVLSARIAPMALKRLKALRADILLKGANTQIRPHTFVNTFPNLLLYVQNVDPATSDWVGVFALQNDPESGVSRLLTAERGQFRLSAYPALKLEAVLSRGVSLEYPNSAQAGDSVPTVSRAASDFQKLSIRLADREGDPEAAAATPLNEMTLRELNEARGKAKTPKEKAQAAAEWHRRFAFPFACLILTAITFVTAIQGRHFSTRARTVIAILFLAMGYYLLLITGQNLAASGRIPPWLGAWFANLLGAALVVRALVSTRKGLPGLSLLDRFAGGGAASPATDRPTGAAATASRGWFGLDAFNLINLLVVSEIAKFYFISVVSLVVTSIIFTLFDLIPAIIKTGTSLLYAASYLGYLAPQLAYVVSPFSLLVALLMGFSVLSRTNQLVVVAGAGQGKWRLIASALAVAAGVGGGLWLLSNYILPYTNREQDVRYHRIKGKQLEQTAIAFGKKWVFGRNNTIYSFQRIEEDRTLVNASVYHLTREQGLLDTAIHFRQAKQTAPTVWEPADGWAELIRSDLSIDRRPLSTQPHILTIEDGAGLFTRTVNQSSKMAEWDLRQYIAQLKSIGVATLDLQLDLGKRLAFPFSCLTLAVLAIPFISIKQSRRASPLLSVAISVGIGLVFWLLMTFFEAAGKQNSLPVSVAVWAPQILFGAIGLYLNFFRHRVQ
jgi:lipopolysaccharide export system permease protein